MELRQRALEVLCLRAPGEKTSALREPWAVDPSAAVELTPGPAAARPVNPDAIPGRPELPRLIAATDVPHRSPFTAPGYAALIHAICHIEFNAINLALDAIWRFDGMPRAYYLDWLRVAREEAYHFGLLREHLQSLGHDYGDFEAHDGLWAMCVKTQHDVTARMALVPRLLEARGLDASPLLQARLRKVGTPASLRAVDILEIILRDEVGHVAIGNHWYRWLCERAALDPLEHYQALVLQYGAPRLKPPFNHVARAQAGFTQAELDALGGADPDPRLPV